MAYHHIAGIDGLGFPSLKKKITDLKAQVEQAAGATAATNQSAAQDQEILRSVPGFKPDDVDLVDPGTSFSQTVGEQTVATPAALKSGGNSKLLLGVAGAAVAAGLFLWKRS